MRQERAGHSSTISNATYVEDHLLLAHQPCEISLVPSMTLLLGIAIWSGLAGVRCARFRELHWSLSDREGFELSQALIVQQVIDNRLLSQPHLPRVAKAAWPILAQRISRRRDRP
jgi:hypothetical protein